MQKALIGIPLLFMIGQVHAQSWTPASPNIYFNGGKAKTMNADPTLKVILVANVGADNPNNEPVHTLPLSTERLELTID